MNRPQYTPPAKIVALRRKLALLPAIMAEEGDALLLLDPLDETSPYLRLAERKHIELISADQLPGRRFKTIVPWGWNPTLRGLLTRYLGEDNNIIAEDRLADLRALAHRRTTISFSLTMREALEDVSEKIVEGVPGEISDEESLVSFLETTPDAYLKAPWSSSGRGTFRTDGNKREKILVWAAGVMRSQGSLMAERAEERTLDFASEWTCRGGKAEWRGWSVFEADRYGRYLHNLAWRDKDLRELIARKIAVDPDILIEAQNAAIEKLIAPRYDGPVGIDMLATPSGRVNPYVEINLRRTMGMVAAAFSHLVGKNVKFSPLAPDALYL